MDLPRLQLLSALLSLAVGCASSVIPGSESDAGTGVPVPNAPSCFAANPARVSISYSGPAAAAYDCSNRSGNSAILDRIASVTRVADTPSGSHIALDFCGPLEDCPALPGSIDIDAAGFSLTTGPGALAAGQFVRIRSQAVLGTGCTMQIEISNAPAWEGTPNTVRTDSALLAAASSGAGTSLSGSTTGVGVSLLSIGCVGSHTGCGTPEQYALSVQPTCLECLRDPDPLRADQGTSVRFDSENLHYEVYNASSYDSGACDDSGDYEWTVRQVP